MASRALSNILGGVMAGAAGSLRDRRRKKEEEEAYKTTQGRQRESMEMRDEFARRREDRQREQRKADTQEAYNTNQKRIEELQRQQLEKIAKLYPDRWQDPTFQQQVSAEVMGLKVPPKPADKEIARLFMEGEEAEAMKRAATSNNPKDLEFYKVMAQTIMQSKKLDMLLNPQKYQQPQTGSIDKPDAAFIQSALQQGTGEGINAMMGMIPGGQSALGRVMPFSPTQQQPKVMPFDPTDKRFKAEIALLDKAMKQQENIIKALRDRSQSYGLSESQKKQLESELEREAKKLRTMQKNYLIKAEGGDPKKKRQEIFDKFNNLLDSGLKSLQPR